VAHVDVLSVLIVPEFLSLTSSSSCGAHDTIVTKHSGSQKLATVRTFPEIKEGAAYGYRARGFTVRK
jgi:hypothetical protein